MSREEYALFETRLGTCGIAWMATGSAQNGLVVTFLQLPEKSARLTEARLAERSGVQARSMPPPIAELIGRVQRHLAGEPQDFRDVAVDLGSAGTFAREVYAAARKIPAGRTMTYGEVARAVKRPGAARAVGQVLARNPVPLIIPCHRVLAAGNRPGGFSAPGGVATKAKMLACEGAVVGL
jgi:O-6-methylguanine DNA methyltransferase